MSRIRLGQISPDGLAGGLLSLSSGTWTTAPRTDGLRLPVLEVPPAQASLGAMWVDSVTGALWIQSPVGPVQCPVWDTGQAALAEMGSDAADVVLGTSWVSLPHPVTLRSAGPLPAVFWDSSASVLRSNYDALMFIAWTVPFQWSATDVIDDQGVLVSFRVLVNGSQVGVTGEFLAVGDADGGPPPKTYSATTSAVAPIRSMQTVELQVKADRGTVKAIGSVTSGATMQRRAAFLRLA